MRERLTQMHTEPFQTEREWDVEGIPVLTATVSLPQPVSTADKVSRRIQRYYQLQSRSFLRYCEGCLLPQAEAEYHTALAASAPLPQFRADLTAQVTYQGNGLWSLYTQSREVTLPGRTLLCRRSDTWDLYAGYPVPLSAFFPQGRGWKRGLLAAADAEVQRQEKAGVARYHEGWRKALRRQFHSQNYYLTSEGLAFFYPMYAIAPALEGIPVFTVPYETPGFRFPQAE